MKDSNDTSRYFRTYGNAPFGIAVVHGGTCARGEMAPVARELSVHRGIIEPFQTSESVEGQIEELATLLERHGELPQILIGYSWGAWLCSLLAARYPHHVRKLILISSGPFQEKYSSAVRETRMARLDEKSRIEMEDQLQILRNSSFKEMKAALRKIGIVFQQVDAYDPMEYDFGETEIEVDIFHSVWNEAVQLRRNGELVKALPQITCPVVAIHGDHDPHPVEGVRDPLSGILPDFRLVSMERCGHKPWIEKQARDTFYSVLKNEIEDI